MINKPAILISLTVLVLSSLACSIGLPVNTQKTGDTQTLTVEEEHSTGSPVNLTLSMGAGKFTLKPGTEKLVEGIITFNVPELKPVIDRGVGSLSIEQEFNWDKLPVDLDNTINEWDLKLGAKPMDLTINGGAYDASFDLSGLAITNLSINEGASSTEVLFNEPNPETMESLTYHTGASQVSIMGLGNANFKQMEFSSGAGSYTLDFGGSLKQDASVRINSAVSNVEIIIPKGMACQVDVTDGVSNVSISGTWTNKDKVYSTSGEGPTLFIRIQMGLGNIVLTQSED